MSDDCNETSGAGSGGWAVLRRDSEVHVLNLSGSGCLIESRRRIVVGTLGTLTVPVNDEDYTDDVQVVRCDAIEGAGSVFHVGVRFLWTAPPHKRSLRRIVPADIVDAEGWLTPKTTLN